MSTIAKELAIILGLEPDAMIDFYPKSAEKPLRIHPSIAEPLQQLLTASEAAGLPVRVLSAYRDFERQKLIWNEKWRGQRLTYDADGQPLDLSKLEPENKLQALLRWSAFPGLSRHHWGSDLDVFAGDAIEAGYQVELLPEEFSEDGPCFLLNQWLEQNCANHGFFRPYYPSTGGVSTEPWHLSYRQTSTTFLELLNKNKAEVIDFLVEQDIDGLPYFLKAADDIFANFVNNIQHN